MTNPIPLPSQNTDPFKAEMNRSYEVWEDAGQTAELKTVTGKKPANDTKVSVLYDGEFLYFRFICRSDHLISKFTQHNDPVWEEEAVEVFLQPPGLKNYYYEFDVNPNNAVCDLIVVNNNKPGSGRVFYNIREWNCRGLQTRVHVEGSLNDPGKAKYWIAEFKIPLEQLPKAENSANNDGIWRCNLYRIDYSGEKPEFQAWNPPGKINFHLPEFFRSISLESEDLN